MTKPSTTTTIADLLAARADDPGTALLSGDDAWTWREFVAESTVRAAALRELSRDASGPWHVGILMDNDPEYLFLIAGAALAGVTVVGVNPTRRGAELAADVARTDCGLIVVGASRRELVADCGDVEILDTASTAYAAVLDEHRHARIDDFRAFRGVNHDLLLLFTSGSTGAPKAVICSSARLAAIGELNVRGLGRDDVAYSAMPLFHGNALMSAWAPILAHGGTFAIRPRFSASGFLPDVRRFGATFFNYVGRSLTYILAQPESSDESRTDLRLGFGTEASAVDREEFTRRFNCRIIESYGSSEGVCVILRDPDTPPGALGAPRTEMGLEILHNDGTPCRAAIFDVNGIMTNAEDAIGEIVARGGGARFEGYYNNPDATAEKIRDGDYWSGDLAYRDSAGVFWFAGRTGDWIRVDSENFATAPLERIVSRFPGPRGVAAYGIPDPRTGDRVMIALEMAADDFDPDTFAEFLSAQPDLGTKWTPSLVRLTSALPLTATRKLDKPALRRAAWATDDPIFEFRDGDYHPFDARRADELADEFRKHGRAELLPQARAV
ncbi:AMP-binding protein [Gordonia sp. SID5947]|uniref:AMP-binding protein n=1 Tax=Gordonia sp. SID5947 TaxID=2690315 RepID=UPI001370DC8F|nr:AMP-binding protein [Gordonia sp. SID5947]MYR05894.1 AMP-binding protein [Gordonia sp. SID5947]